MQLVVVHYHLNRGGVTQAVLNHLHALATLPADRRPERVLVLHSGQKQGWPDSIDVLWGDRPAPFEVVDAAVPEIEYDTPNRSANPAKQAVALRSALDEHRFAAADSLLHVHNHSLGKNAALPCALRGLAESGYRLLLQTHDFAEDFRPANYRHLMRAKRAGGPDELAEQLYPEGPGVHYAVLNRRDHSLLSGAGVPADRLHTLPNPVLALPGRPPRDEARSRVLPRLGLADDTRLVVYPVRGIRRKNVGEMLLHSALAGDASCYAITLAPTNPVEAPSFARWVDLADELKLNCRFDIGGAAEPNERSAGGGAGVPFEDALAAADALITTSVAEGFGMVFLESWLAGSVLVGRDLPEITADFRDAGLRFDRLTPELLVPTEWLDADRLEVEVNELHRWTCQDYGLAEPVHGGRKIAAGPTIDFGSLPGGFQSDVIRRAAADPAAARETLCGLNPGLAAQLDARSDDHRQAIADNAERVREAYSPSAIGRRLADVYAAVMAEPPAETLGSIPNGRSILETLLTIDRLQPVRLEP